MANNLLNISGLPSTNYYLALLTQANLFVNGVTPEAYNSAHWTNYADAFSAVGPGTIYSLAFPALAAGVYDGFIYLRAGGSAATGDLAVGVVQITWDGTNILNVVQIDGSGFAKISNGTGTGQITLTAGEVTSTNGGGGGPTAAQIATAVWQDLLAGGDFGVGSSIGILLASGGTAPTTAQIVAAIQAAGAITFTLVSPIMQNGSITLVRGDDYFNADGRALTWTFSAGAVPNLAGATVTISGSLSPSISNSGSKTYTATGVVSASGTGIQSIYFELPASLTSGLAVGAMAYDFAVVATLTDGHAATLAQGTLTIKAQS